MHTVSFFSFKGGVGRTNLLLNCAYKLASDGAFVVVADWDLHAPGLTMMEAMAQPAEEKEPVGPDVRRGVLDFLDTALDEQGEIPDPRSMARPTRLAERARTRLDPPAGAFRGDVWFVPAGRFDPADPDRDFHDQLLRVQSRNLAGWIRQFEPGGEVGDPRGVLKYFRDRIAGLEHPTMDGRKPDYLLIDSRTGMTEIGDLLLSADFVDRMVVVCGFNDQNISGLEAVIRDLQQHISRGELHTRLTLVAAPVPQGEEALKQRRVDVIEGLLQRLRRDIGFGELEFMPELHMIPYHPRIALTEAVMIESFPASEPAKAMLEVVKEIELKKELIPPSRPGAGLRAAEAGVLEVRPESGSSEPTILHHPWSRLPQWNWPDPGVTIEQFLPELDAEHHDLLNGLVRTLSQDKDQIGRILDSLTDGKVTEHQVIKLRRILREEQRQHGELGRRRWPQLVAAGVQNLEYWLELWCKRGHGEAASILESVIAGKRDEYLGCWAEIGYFWFRLTTLAMKESLWAQAEAAYRRAIKLEPEYAHPWSGLGNLLQDHLDRYEEAEAAYRKAMELDPESAVPWHGLGNLLQAHLDRHEEAEAAYRKALELDPKSAAPWHGLGNLFKEHPDRYEESEAAYRKALELDPKSAAPWNGLGNLFKDCLDRYDAAEVAYRKAMELDPRFVQPWCNLGQLLHYNLKRYEEADAAYRRAAEIDPRSALPWGDLGNLLTRPLARFEEAEAAFRKAAELDPKYARPWAGLGSLYMQQSRLDDAEAAYRKALELGPEDLGVSQEDAELALVQDDLDRALSRLESGRKLINTPWGERDQEVLKLALALVGGAGTVADTHSRLLKLNASVEKPTTWIYDDMGPFIERLPPPAQELLRAWIAAVKHEDGSPPEEAFEAWLAASA